MHSSRCRTPWRQAALSAALFLTPVFASADAYRAVWADAFSVGFKSNGEISSLVSRAVSGRYNVIVAEVLAFHDTAGDGHGAYWNSSIVPRATDISGGIDPLASLISQAHAAGLQVHAWIVPYRVCSAWPPAGNAYLSAHPEFLMVPQANMGGGPAKVGGYYTLDPGSNEAQEYLTSIVQELVGNYEIDGINLDYIRYVQTDAGYPANNSYPYSSLARFRALTGYSGTPAPTGVTSWNDFRRQTINEYVRRLHAEIASSPNPRQPLRLSADLIAFGDAPASFSSSSAYTLHQNWKYWMEHGWLDMGIPMNYKRENNSSQATWYRNWVNASLNWKGPRHMLSGQANYLNSKANSITQLSYALNAGVNGTCNFSYDATADENGDGTPEADWSWYTYVSANLFTTSTPVPSMAWRNPATATEGTVWGRVLNDLTGLPVDGASVQVGGLTPVQTDGNGYYVVTLVPASAGGTSYTVTASGAGCPQVTTNLVVNPAGVIRRDFDLCPTTSTVGDMDEDGDVDADDLNLFLFCMQGPGAVYPSGNFCLRGDGEADDDIDAADLLEFQLNFNP